MNKYSRSIFKRAEAARKRAQIRHPQPTFVCLKVAEEAGEAVQAAVHYCEGRKTWQDVEGEAVQTIAMLMRLLIEGDHVNGIYPPGKEPAL